MDIETLWQGRSHRGERSPFDKAHDQDHPAKPERLSDVQCKKGFNIALRAYALSQVEGLQISHIISLLFCASKTYVARRAYSEAMLNTLR